MKENECAFSDMCLNFGSESCSKYTCEKYRDYSDFPEFFETEDDIIEKIF